MLKYLVLLSFYFSFIVSKFSLEFGEFDIKITKYEDCNGPKRRSCVESTVKIVNDVTLEFDYNITQNMKAVKGKITGRLNNGSSLLRIPIKDICEHIFLRAFLQTILNSPDHCAINKGSYQFSVDIQKLSRNFYGGRFMYGNWTFQWILYNDVCNMHCGFLSLSLTPAKTHVDN